MNATFEKLKALKENYPALTYDNRGYDELSNEIKESHKVQINEVFELLDSAIEGIVRFQNFKPRKDGTFSIRCQCKYDAMFTGVVYLKEEDFDKEVIQII